MMKGHHKKPFGCLDIVSQIAEDKASQDSSIVCEYSLFEYSLFEYSLQRLPGNLFNEFFSRIFPSNTLFSNTLFEYSLRMLCLQICRKTVGECVAELCAELSNCCPNANNEAHTILSRSKVCVSSWKRFFCGNNQWTGGNFRFNWGKVTFNFNFWLSMIFCDIAHEMAWHCCILARYCHDIAMMFARCFHDLSTILHDTPRYIFEYLFRTPLLPSRSPEHFAQLFAVLVRKVRARLSEWRVNNSQLSLIVMPI